MKKILFFINGSSPSSSQMKQAFKIEGDVEFRDVTLFDPENGLEKCDGVMGEVPTLYLEKFPQVSASSKNKDSTKEIEFVVKEEKVKE